MTSTIVGLLLCAPALAHAGADPLHCLDPAVVAHPRSDATDVPLNPIITHDVPLLRLEAEDGTQVPLVDFTTPADACVRQQFTGTFTRPMRPSVPLEPNTRYVSPEASVVRFTTGSTTDLERPPITIGPDEDPGFGFRAQLYDAQDTILLIHGATWLSTPVDGVIDLSASSFSHGEAVVFTAYDPAGNFVVLRGQSDAPALTEQGCSTSRATDAPSSAAALMLAIGALAARRRRPGSR